HFTQSHFYQILSNPILPSLYYNSLHFLLFFNSTTIPDIYTLSLHDALPILFASASSGHPRRDITREMIPDGCAGAKSRGSPVACRRVGARVAGCLPTGRGPGRWLLADGSGPGPSRTWRGVAVVRRGG